MSLLLVAARANAMQKACEANPGTMAAIIGLPDEKVEEINLRILPSIKGISQVSIATTLYLCGNNEPDDPSSQTSGAFLLSVSGPTPREVSVLINSRYPHYNPSLYGYRDNHLIVIGGKYQVKCEMYNIKFNRWRQMHDLPEELVAAQELLAELVNPA